MRLSDLSPAAAARVLAASGVRSGPLEGPWDQAFWVSLPFPPMSKSNARRYRAGTVGPWRDLKDFEAKVRAATVSAVPDGWDLGEPGQVRSRPTVISVIFARTLLDVSNLPKSIHDAVEGVVYLTDASVSAAVEVVERSRQDQRTVICFARLPAQADGPMVDDAVISLYRHGRDRFSAAS